MAGEAIATEVEEILNDYGERVVAALKDNLVFDKKTASGGLSDSIKFVIKFIGTEYVFELYLADYYKWVDKGRGPTRSGGGAKGQPLDWSKPSLRKKILEWMMYKRITPSAAEGYGKNKSAGKVSLASDIKAARSMAYLISRKIHKEGYEGSGFFSKVFEPGGPGSIANLEAQLSQAIGKAIKVELQIL